MMKRLDGNNGQEDKKLMISRRQILKGAVLGGAGLYFSGGFNIRRALAMAIPGGALDPAAVAKYVTPLHIPRTMPRSLLQPFRGVDFYAIAVGQFKQQVLPPGLPSTSVWGYGSVDNLGTFHYPAPTIEARFNRPIRVSWINGLLNKRGYYLPHLLPVDPTLHWANPSGGIAGRDTRPTFTSTPGPYRGPVPFVTHVHGAHVAQESDGYPEAWFLPPARNIPSGYARTGTFYDRFKASSPLGRFWTPGSALFEYPNDQRATTLWYHDHTLGLTRLNLYAGAAGFYLLRGGSDDVVEGVLPSGRYEVPLLIQDRSFNLDGSLFFPDTRAFFDGIAGPYVPTSDVSPLWNPEFFGNMMVVNGNTWPYLNVEKRQYRFRVLNGCNSRFMILRLSNGKEMWQIGSDGGFLPAPVMVNELLLGPAERADIIVDFSDLPVGTTLNLINVGPDEPFGGGTPDVDFPAADPDSTGQVMQFRVVRASSADNSTPAAQLGLPALVGLGDATATRQVSLNEMMSMYPGFDGPAAAMLGTVMFDAMGMPMGHHKMWMDPITESPLLGSTEVWEIYNFTEDAHPIHLHLVQFQIVDRQVVGGDSRLPEPGETGFKDMVIAYPGEITRIKARFDKRGRYVWHCHIVDHEDNEMMRPYEVV
jgi:bilirubin oxidase